MNDADLMAQLREVGALEFDAPMRARIAKIQNTGASVTVFEVLQTGAMLIIVHDAERPRVKTIRRAYEEYMARQVTQ